MAGHRKTGGGGGESLAVRWYTGEGMRRGGGRIGVSSSAEPIQTRNLSYQFLLGGVAKSSTAAQRSPFAILTLHTVSGLSKNWQPACAAESTIRALI